MTDAITPMVLVLQHQADDGPGNLGTWLDTHEIAWQLVDVPAGLPQPGRYAALVVLGSKESAFDDTVPWIAAVREFVTACAGRGTPVLGLCFGAQLLALVLGGEVRRMLKPERGWKRVNGDATTDGHWFLWHQDDIVAPPAATELAHSDLCLQAFAVGDHLGVQFHPELTPRQIEEWLDQEHRATGLAAVAGSVDETLAETVRLGPQAVARAGQLYDRFFSAARIRQPVEG